MVDDKKVVKFDFHKVVIEMIDKYDFITPSENNKLYMYKDGVYCDDGEDFVSDILVKKYKAAANGNNRKEIISQIKILTKKSKDDIDVNENLICLENGVLNIETKELIKHNPDLIFFGKLPVKYDKEASCPKFKKFLSEVVEDREKDWLQEFSGYCLTNDTKYEKAMILHGKGGNGKSTFLKVLRGILGKKNCTSYTLQQLQDKVILVELYGKIANISMDIPNERILNSENIKSIVSGDPVTGRGLFQGPQTFVPKSKLIFSCNNLPEPNMEDGDAFFDRWIYIKFDKKNFRKVDKDGIKLATPNLDNMLLEEESSGILNWALEGLDEVNLTNFGDVVGVKNLWLRNSSSILSYTIDRLEETFDDEDWIVKQDIYKDYRKYCSQNNMIPVRNNSFHLNLNKIIDIEEFNPKVDGKQRKAWVGVKFKVNGGGI